MILSRILAVVAAILLVGAVGVAVLGPPGLPLGRAISLLDHGLLSALHGSIRAHAGTWLWDDVLLPLLVRPAWLVPASIGIILAGASLTVGSRAGRGPHRRPGSPKRWF